uniref:hypothetical protein n=1 Tax=Amycolatopsis sp. CA-096443 TaxID=3239919 RepID=UPI003F49102D
MPQHATADAVLNSISAGAFPTPALAIRTDDPARLAGIRGFAEHQAAAARAIAAAVLRRLAAAPARDDLARASVTALTAASSWRYRLARDLADARGGHGIPTTAQRFRTPIADGDANYDRLGYCGRVRDGSVWDEATRTYRGGVATPAFRTLAEFGRRAADRFAAEAPRQDVLQNLVELDDGTVAGNRLLRGDAAAAAGDELVARITARGLDAGRFETGGAPVYAATAAARDRARLRQAAVAALAGALAAGDRGTAARQWAQAAYLLYQSPQTKKGSDAATRVALVALGTVALGRPPRLPHDIDLRAYVLGQHAFVGQLLALEEAAAR